MARIRKRKVICEADNFNQRRNEKTEDIQIDRKKIHI